MKQIIMVRHAKTTQHGYDQDFDRTLTDRGEEDAEKICLEMLKAGIKPDLIISSPAVRTTQTSQIFAGLCNYPTGKVRYEKKLYSGMLANAFSRMLEELDDSYASVMVVGHNPTVYYFLDFLLPDFMLDVPTCSTVVMDFNIQIWSELTHHSGKIVHRWIPDLL